MRIFLDTSSLIKLYHEEQGTKELDFFLKQNSITSIILSELAKIEFSSAIWKKVRTKELSVEDASELVELFKSDYSNYYFAPTNSNLIESANNLINKYGNNGLRTLDSIQLASAIAMKGSLEIVFTADKLLNELFISEGLKTNVT
ncbi:MAG: type II toxin-antitoxin system VapC family toxin [Polaribacter sp.]